MDAKLIKTNNENLTKIEQDIALNIPGLNKLSNSQLEQIAKLVVVERYKNEMNKDIDLLNFDYGKLKEFFLNTCSNSNSIKTKQAYTRAINDFEKYLALNNINPLKLTTQDADDYIYNLRKQNKSNSTIRQYIGAISSFYSFLERRSNGTIKNSFRGTKARPEQKAVKDNKFYNVCVNSKTMQILENDINTMIENINNKELKAIILIMKNTGLRVGAFENMTLKGNHFKTITKGSEFKGVLPGECLKAIKDANLKGCQPFKSWSADRTKNLFTYHSNKLYKKGLISFAYSCHDLRHYFAINQYNQDKDIYKLSKLLNHSSISITENYLKGLNIIN